MTQTAMSAESNRGNRGNGAWKAIPRKRQHPHKLQDPPAFKARVDDARVMLRCLVPREDIIQKHGSVVLAAALERIECKLQRN